MYVLHNSFFHHETMLQMKSLVKKIWDEFKRKVGYKILLDAQSGSRNKNCINCFYFYP